MSVLSLQWSIFEVDLEPLLGSDRAARRPVLVVSRETANLALPIVTVLPLVSHMPGRRIYPNEVLLPRAKAGLGGDSVAMAHQTRTISKTRLDAPVGVLEDPDLRSAVRQAMRVQLNLEHRVEVEA